MIFAGKVAGILSALNKVFIINVEIFANAINKRKLMPQSTWLMNYIKADYTNERGCRRVIFIFDHI